MLINSRFSFKYLILCFRNIMLVNEKYIVQSLGGTKFKKNVKIDE